MNIILKNREIIREYVAKFNKELGVIAAIMYERNHPENDNAYEDYMEFWNAISFEEKIGNHFICLDIPESMEIIVGAINGDVEFGEGLIDTDRKLKKQFKKKMKES